jgi:hypothetical protein
MRVNHRMPSKSLLLSIFFLTAATAVLAIEVRTMPHPQAAIEQPLPRPMAPQRFQEANADTDIGPGLAEPLLVSSPASPAK